MCVRACVRACVRVCVCVCVCVSVPTGAPTTVCFYRRLALEQCGSAREAVDTVTSLLAKHGQGGPCCEDPSYGQWTYHSAFLFADRHEAWALETAGRLWVAKKITGGLARRLRVVVLTFFYFFRSLPSFFFFFSFFLSLLRLLFLPLHPTFLAPLSPFASPLLPFLPFFTTVLPHCPCFL